MLIAELSSTDVAMRRDGGRVLQHDRVNQGGRKASKHDLSSTVKRQQQLSIERHGVAWL